MKQVVQNLRSGKTEVIEVPFPQLKAGHILVQTSASLVSAGTERMLVDFAEKNLVGKARARPDLVRQIVEKAWRDGILTTLEMAFNRLDQPLPLGYSSAGRIIEIGEGVTGFSQGQRVACGGGGYAVHAEVVCIPRNLIVPIPDQVDDESAAFSTVGAIAMHAFRLCRLQVGERIAIVGLGLVGLLAASIARAAGCDVVGIEVNPHRLKLAQKLGFISMKPEEAETGMPSFTDGKGFDAVLIAADTPAHQPVELAGKIARDRAWVVAAGAVGQSLPRKLYYEKELFFVNSRSYGPGRYDPSYEEKGTDYPIGYVRWTEQRNMAAFLHLVETQKVDVQPFITHRFPIEKAEEAYHLISGKSGEAYLGVLFRYPHSKDEVQLTRQVQVATEFAAEIQPVSHIRVGVIGAGNFASLVLLPVIAKQQGVELLGIASASGLSAKHASQKFGFQYASSSTQELLEDGRINTLFILTRHHLHAQQTGAALMAGKAVFCEKPLAIREDELSQLEDTLRELVQNAAARNSSEGQAFLPVLMVGFNRRFAPMIQEIKRFFSPRQQEMLIHYRINAGYIPKTHWTQDPEVGGGRLIGEVCHFIDTLTYLVGYLPCKVWARALPDRGIYQEDNLLLNFTFPDGSLGVITYVANGNKAFPKERVEIFSGGKVAVLDDFRKLDLVEDGNKVIRRAVLRQDKGHSGEIRDFFRFLKEGGQPPISYRDMIGVSRATLIAQRALRSGTEELIPLWELG
ncbi:MAG: bi-domain-containing oxidoreductase [Chloroflexota bacterium]